MSVKLRLTRMGRRHRPFYRINATDSRSARDGRVLEKLGHFDPIEKDVAKQVVLNKERAAYWLSQGAIPSETVARILAKHGIESKHAAKTAARRAKALSIARSKGRLFDKAQKVAAQKQAEADKAAAEAKAKAAEEAAAAASAAGDESADG